VSDRGWLADFDFEKHRSFLADCDFVLRKVAAGVHRTAFERQTRREAAWSIIVNYLIGALTEDQVNRLAEPYDKGRQVSHWRTKGDFYDRLASGWDGGSHAMEWCKLRRRILSEVVWKLLRTVLTVRPPWQQVDLDEMDEKERRRLEYRAALFGSTELRRGLARPQPASERRKTRKTVKGLASPMREMCEAIMRGPTGQTQKDAAEHMGVPYKTFNQMFNRRVKPAFKEAWSGTGKRR
jgi:hypothetical protein